MKWAIIVNRAEKESLYPAFILGSSAAASGDDVIMFFEPWAAAALKEGYLEGMSEKGMPSMEDMVGGLTAMGGRILMCELAFDALDLKESDLREDVEVVGVTTFVVEASDAQLTFSF